MDIEELELVVMELVSNAGAAKSEVFKALNFARLGETRNVEDCLLKAKSFLKKAHNTQTSLIRKEIEGKDRVVSLLMVHAQDHIASAELMLELSDQILWLTNQVLFLKNKIS